jgi:L-ascorbate metabolism protein UlaG (beta-lactamase superfamily)
MARRNSYYRGTPSANFDGQYFFREGQRDPGFKEFLKWNTTSYPARWPWRVPNKPFPPPPRRVEGQELVVTWIGHSTVLIQTAGLNILTDPFFSKRASPMRFAGPRRVRKPGIALADLPPIDLALVSHNHYDHMDLPALRRIIKEHKPEIVTPLGNGAILARTKAGPRVTELDWWQSTDTGGIEITLLPAIHWSKRGLTDRNHALWGAFAINTPSGWIYFAGDTGYDDGSLFRNIGRRLGPPRLSLLPIGAYEPRWFMKHHHFNPDDAMMAHRDLASRTSLAIHHSTIRLTNEAIDTPAKDHGEALRRHGVSPSDFRIVEVGEPLWVP